MDDVSTNGQPGARRRILVVDDEPSIVDAVATALRYEGFEVEKAATGRQALDTVARFDPDLIVLDWMLPDIEGIEVGRRLRRQGCKSAVLFLTAKDATENKVEALRAGGDDDVTKPFSLPEVLSKGQILQNVGRYDFGGYTNVVETYVSYLRRKIDALGPPLIKTVRQVG